MNHASFCKCPDCNEGQTLLFSPPKKHREVEETSREAFLDLVASGRQDTLQLQAAYWLGRAGPCTASELASASGVTGIWKRLSELERLEVAAVVGTRPCRVSGKQAKVWALSRQPR